MPTSPAPGLEGVSDKRAFGLGAVVTVIVFLTGVYAPYFIVDSWSYLEMSKTVFTDFYRFSTLRQFENPSLYSNSFPPLWPVLLAIARHLGDLGIYTGYVLNCLVCIGLLAALMRLFPRIGLPSWVGTACYLSLLGFTPFLQDALGAKTMALSAALLVCALTILVGQSITMYRVALAGSLMGLGCLNRFDALPAAAVIGSAFAFRAYRHGLGYWRAIAVFAVYCMVLGVILSPWAIYGEKRFGKVFPSDNTRQVLRARRGNVLDYYESPLPSELAKDPAKWATGLVSDKARAVASGFYGNVMDSELPALVMIVLVVWGATRPRALPMPAIRFTLLALILIPIILFPTALVGYSDSRYYSAPILLLLVILFSGLVSLTPTAWSARRTMVLLLVAALPIGESIIRPLRYNRRYLFAPSRVMVPLSPTPDMQQLTAAVRRDAGGQPHRLLLTFGYIESAKYGALTGEPTTLMPRLVGGTFAAFARDWHITHVYDPPKRPTIRFPHPPVADPAIIMRAINTPGVELVPLDLPGLYRIRLTPPGK